MAGCYATVSPGHAGILVEQTGSQRGVQDFPVKTGRVWYNPFNETVLEYPTYMQTYVWTKNPNEGDRNNPDDESITFTTKDSMIVNADFNISYEVSFERVSSFYVKFRNDDIKAFTYEYLHNVARNCINDVSGQYTVEQIMGDNAHFLHDANDCIQKQTAEFGVKVDAFGLVGAPRPPNVVLTQINSKVQAEQLALQKQNEIAQAEADAKKRVAQATGEAEANQKLSASLTPTLLEYKRLSIQEQAVAKWDGARPQVEGAGSGGMLLSISPQK